MPYNRELEAIRSYYGDQTARRSKEPLMKHILDSIAILYGINASERAKQAFCIHPIVQMYVPIDVTWSEAFELACEYRDKANAYLCKNSTDWISTIQDVFTVVGTMSDDCADMLFADKFQNRMSFNTHHKDTHARSKQLSKYFDLWLEYIDSELWKISRSAS